MGTLKLTPRAVQIFMVVGAIVGVGYFFWLARGALFPFLVGAAIAYVIAPLVEKLAAIQPWYSRRPETARGLAIVVIYGLGLGAIILAGIYFVPVAIDEIDQVIQNVPDYYDDAQAEIDEWLEEYEQNVPEDVRRRIEEALSGLGGELGRVAQGVLESTVSMVFSTFSAAIGYIAVPFFVFYSLKDRDRGLGRFYSWFPENVRPDVRECIRIANHVIGAYVRAQLLLGLVIFVATYIGLTLMGIDYALALAIFAGVTELVPIIGPIIGFIPAFIIVLATEPDKWWWVIVFYLAVQQAENNLLVPRISGQSVNFHPAVVLVLIAAAGAVFGIWGIIIIVPIAAAIRDVYAYIYRRLGEEHALRQTLVEVPSPLEVTSPASLPEVDPGN